VVTVACRKCVSNKLLNFVLYSCGNSTGVFKLLARRHRFMRCYDYDSTSIRRPFDYSSKVIKVTVT